MIISSYYIYIPPPFFSSFNSFVTKEVGICVFFSKTCLLLLSFSTPEFTHLPHHDNYFHGNHSWHHRHKLTARETRATETLLEAYGLCDLRDSKARTKGTWSWGSNGNVILEIYSYILIFLGASHCPEACEYGQRAMIFLKWRHSTCTQKQTNRTNRLQPEDINP